MGGRSSEQRRNSRRLRCSERTTTQSGNKFAPEGFVIVHCVFDSVRLVKMRCPVDGRYFVARAYDYDSVMRKHELVYIEDNPEDESIYLMRKTEIGSS